MTKGRGNRALIAGLLAISFVVGNPGFSVHATERLDVQAVDALMLDLMSKYKVPGAALGLIQDGKIVLEKGYGFRDLDTHTRVTPATLFNVGSISKSFRALDLAQLVYKQKIDLDTPIISYVPEIRLSDPIETRTVTLRQLLSLSAGLPPDEQWPLEVPRSRDEIIREFATMPITAPPGTRFQYCSRCVVLAAYVLENVTHQTWETYTRTHIFTPLGMSTAVFGPSGLERAIDGALPYRYDAVAGQVLVPWGRLEYLDSLGPAAGIDASVTDMTRYALFQVGDGTMSGQRVVSEHMLEELHRPEIAVPPSWTSVPIRNLHYALGWFTGEYRGAHVVYHNGSNPGYRASILLVPTSKAGVVVLTNGESMGFINTITWRLIEELLDIQPRPKPAS
jgi:CubicO group peptidase (beta-lactamase class C family)